VRSTNRDLGSKLRLDEEIDSFEINRALSVQIITVLPDLKVGLGMFGTNAESQWDPVYNAFNRVHWCGNETMRQQYCNRDFDAANLRPALEQGCGRQTPSAGILSLHANLVYVLRNQNVEESPIEVCAQLRDLQKECDCAVPASDEFCGQTRFLIDESVGIISAP